jgi:CheY-like chemotaxis protein
MLVRHPRVLSVSYDHSLLKTRELILSDRGCQVTSALGFEKAMEHCANQPQFDLLVLGHSIPYADKETLIETFRTNCPGRVVALKRFGEKCVPGADVEIQPEPEELIAAVAAILSHEPPNLY